MSRTDCDELKERLAEIVEAVPVPGPPEGAAEAGATERARLLAHASLCPECGELLRSYRALLQGMKALDRVRAPADLLDRVWKRIDAAVLSPPVPPEGAACADGAAPAGRIAAAGPMRFRRLYLGLAATLLLGLGLGLYLRFTFPGKPVIEVAKSTASDE